MTHNLEFDAIVVGSGPGGATVARELSRRNKRVLVLERGGSAPVPEGLRGMASVVNAVSVGENLSTARAFTTGGTTAVYFGVAENPPLDTFRALGVDLAPALAEAKRELPLAELPDELLGAQALRVRKSATELGYDWKKNPMLVDLAKCRGGYSADARWNARNYLGEAVGNGAALVTRARVQKVLTEGNRAIGVEYRVQTNKKEFEIRRVHAAKIVLAAGGATTPLILRESGIRNAAGDGFYCHPSFAVFGIVPGMNAGENFVGSMSASLGDGINVGDANFGRAFYRVFMLGGGKFLRALLHAKSIGVGVMVEDSLGGSLREDGRYAKQLGAEETQKLARGEQAARRIVQNAGGRFVFRSSVRSAHMGGAVRINEHVDTNLETELASLHVCDGSVIPANAKSPALTLVCLGKYLAQRLAV